MGAIYAAAKSKRAEARQGACLLWGRCATPRAPIEPHVIQTLPYLLVGFSDPSDDVRRATPSTSRVIMSKLSGRHRPPPPSRGPRGFSLAHQAWRHRVRQHGVLRPPPARGEPPHHRATVIKVLNDSHPPGQVGRRYPLSSFTDVIRTPRSGPPCRNHVGPHDPNANTHAALKALLDTNFRTTSINRRWPLVPILQGGCAS
ncbi:translational activator of GCN4, partial [Massospora cicadina]